MCKQTFQRKNEGFVQFWGSAITWAVVAKHKHKLARLCANKQFGLALGDEATKPDHGGLKVAAPRREGNSENNSRKLPAAAGVESMSLLAGLRRCYWHLLRLCGEARLVVTSEGDFTFSQEGAEGKRGLPGLRRDAAIGHFFTVLPLDFSELGDLLLLPLLQLVPAAQMAIEAGRAVNAALGLPMPGAGPTGALAMLLGAHGGQLKEIRHLVDEALIIPCGEAAHRDEVAIVLEVVTPERQPLRRQNGPVHNDLGDGRATVPPGRAGNLGRCVVVDERVLGGDISLRLLRRRRPAT